MLNRLQAALVAEAFRMVRDGVMSAEDVDACVKDGLGLRWSFMGPFETIDLNAPGGVEDYVGRFGPLMGGITAGADPLRLRRADGRRRDRGAARGAAAGGHPGPQRLARPAADGAGGAQARAARLMRWHWQAQRIAPEQIAGGRALGHVTLLCKQ